MKARLYTAPRGVRVGTIDPNKMRTMLKPLHGRGASDNPPNRFEHEWQCPDPDLAEAEEPAPTTQFLPDNTQTIISTNDSPDVGPGATLNPYRGCEHGCIYCYARPTHEYLGFSAGLDFETKILVKLKAPELLREELQSPKWRPQVVAMSGVTDPYQPAERRFQLTRRCLEVFAEFRNPVTILSKNLLVMRDIDVLQELARHQAIAVFLSVTSLRGELQKVMEPRTAHPQGRLAAIEALSRAGIPVGVNVAPVIPGLTDHELPAIVAAAARAGARFAGCVPLRLPHGVAHLFEQWLTQHFPDRAEKVLHRIRSIRGGRLNDPNFGSRMRGSGPFAQLMRQLLATACEKAGMEPRGPHLSTAAFRRPPTGQTLPFPGDDS